MTNLLDRIRNDFAYHQPTGGKVAKHQQVREACYQAAQELVSVCPEGRELSTALTHLESAMMFANAALARYPEKS